MKEFRKKMRLFRTGEFGKSPNGGWNSFLGYKIPLFVYKAQFWELCHQYINSSAIIWIGLVIQIPTRLSKTNKGKIFLKSKFDREFFGNKVKFGLKSLFSAKK